MILLRLSDATKVNQMDTITIRDLKVNYRVGVPDAERASPQRLLITVEMEHDFGEASAGDDLGKTIDYFVVSRRLLSFGDGRQWRLLETLAAEIAQMIVQEFGAIKVSVEVKKFIIPQADYVSVRVTRGAN